LLIIYTAVTVTQRVMQGFAVRTTLIDIDFRLSAN